jgi:muramoyltetrapeptide carboxypeptidase
MNEQLLVPKKLKKGDRLGLICPSEPVYFPERLEGGIKELESLGFECVLGKYANTHHKYMAGSDRERAEDLNLMFSDKSIDGIITITGGSSANRILPLIDYDIIKKNPKVFLGISDISVLLNSIFKKTNLVTFHGPYVLFGICEMSEYNKEYFKKAFMENQPIGEVHEYAPRDVLKEGKASGKLLGGNISSFRSIIGTEYEPDWNDAILFWEEYKTEPHNIDRMLMHLKLAGVFDKIKGMISGNLTMCEEKKYKEKSFDIKEIILDHCKDYGFPIMYNLDFGHNCQNATLPIGIRATIDTYKNKFSIDEACVR